MDFSGMTSIMPSKPQNDGGKRGQTMSAFRFEPKGANESAGLSFDCINEGWSETAGGRGMVILFSGRVARTVRLCRPGAVGLYPRAAICVPIAYHRQNSISWAAYLNRRTRNNQPVPGWLNDGTAFLAAGATLGFSRFGKVLHCRGFLLRRFTHSRPPNLPVREARARADASMTLSPAQTDIRAECFIGRPAIGKGPTIALQSSPSGHNPPGQLYSRRPRPLPVDYSRETAFEEVDRITKGESALHRER